ncbi:DsbA family protein [Tardiphaga robiniae]|nr:DsbA family protein [Tardiphaga robiniae]
MAMQSAVYLFDPLCGWCYGATPATRRLRDAGLVVTPVPTGLFADHGARTMDDQFAAYAWSNDQKIARLSGQRFTEAYRHKVLIAGSRFDSGPATLALTAVALEDEARELDALSLIQEARYVDGRDVASLPLVTSVLAGAGFAGAASRLQAPDPALLSANEDRIARGRRLMTTIGINGVPALVLSDERGTRAIAAGSLFGDLDALLAQVKAA